jgi:hypothetical protein
MVPLKDKGNFPGIPHADPILEAARKTLERLKGRLEYRLNERLCEMKPDHDDSITGFNEACVIVAALLDEELSRLEAEEQP